jgi:hypothetical protein
VPRRAERLGHSAVAGLFLFGASFASEAEARARCSYSGAPQNLLSVTAERGAYAEIIRSGEEIVVWEFRRRPSRCRGGASTVLNTDTIRVFLRGVLTFVDVLLEGGPFAPGATPESEGASEIEVKFRGEEPFATVVGTSGADEFHWNLGGTGPALNLNPGGAGDQDVDVAIIEAGLFGGLLIAGPQAPTGSSQPRARYFAWPTSGRREVEVTIS